MGGRFADREALGKPVCDGIGGGFTGAGPRLTGKVQKLSADRLCGFGFLQQIESRCFPTKEIGYSTRSQPGSLNGIPIAPGQEIDPNENAVKVISGKKKVYVAWN